MQKLANIMLSWKTHFADDATWFASQVHHEFIDKAIVSFCNKILSCVAATDGHWHCKHSV